MYEVDMQVMAELVNRGDLVVERTVYGRKELMK